MRNIFSDVRAAAADVKKQVQKQNQKAKERFEDFKEAVIDVKVAAKMGMMKVNAGVSAAMDDGIDFIQILNPAQFQARRAAVPDEEELESEEAKRAKAEAAEERRAAQAQRVERHLASVPPEIFSEPGGQADPLRAVLCALPAGFGDEQLREEEERLATVVSVVSTELSAKVLDNYSSMVAGIGLVSQVMTHLQGSVIVAKNARRTLARADAEVSSALRVGLGTRKKGNLLALLEILGGLSAVLGVEAELRAALASGRHVEAVLAYAEAHAQLQQLGDLDVALPVRDGMAGLLWTVVRQVEESLQAAAAAFDPAAYTPLLEAYVLLGEEAKPLGERVAECAVRAMEAATEEPLRALTADAARRADADVARIAAEAGAAPPPPRRLAFKELVRLLPRDALRVCLGRTLVGAFAVLASLERMHGWHKERFEELGGEWVEAAPPPPPAPKWLADPKSGYFYDGASGCHWDPKSKMYYDPKTKAWGSVGPPPPGSAPAAAPAAAPVAAAAPVVTEPQSPGEKAAAAAAAAHQRHRSGLDRDSYALSAMAAGERNACEAAAAAIDRARRSVWELASTRVALLLGVPAAPSAPGVLRLLSAARRWAAAGEGFSRADAQLVRQHAQAAAERYFEQLHRGRLEALQARLSAEAWAPVTGDAAGALWAGLHEAAAQLAGLPAALAKRQAAGVGEPAGAGEAARRLFADAVAAGNPFEGLAEGRGAAWEQAGEEEAALAASAASLAAADGGFDAGQREKMGLRGAKPVVTVASQYALQVCTEYLRMLRQLRGSPAVFTGITHLFEFSLLAVFRAFCAAPPAAAAAEGAGASLAALAGGAPPPQPADEFAAALVTPRLRNTLSRVAALQASAKLAAGAEPQGAQQRNSSGNLYGLPQRSVATEALACVADELKRLRPLLKAALPAESGGKLDHFFTHSVDAVHDLREHVYAAVARQLMSVGWLAEAVGDGEGAMAAMKAGKYDLKEPPLDSSPWAAKLEAEFRSFAAKVGACDLAPGPLGAMWDNGTQAAAEALLAGLARVKRCSQEGRALMALDVQTVAASLRRLVPPTARPEAALRAVEAYVKAFYVPEGELLQWAQTHPEYTTAQVTALVGQIAYANKWSRQQKADLIARIEAER